MLGCKPPSSCLREREGVEFQGPIVRSSVGKKGENNEGILKQRQRDALLRVIGDTPNLSPLPRRA